MQQCKVYCLHVRDIFLDSLPGQLPIERSVCHTIPLQDSQGVSPARKSHSLDKHAQEECKQQVASLLVQGHV